MVAEFKVVGSEKLARRFAEKDPQTLFKCLKRDLFLGLSSNFLGRLKSERLSGRPGLRALTGTFRRSFTAQVKGSNLANLVGRAGTPIFWAGVHETGKRIVARNPSGFLTIPIRSAGAAFSSKIVGFRRVPSVFIPPRLQFFKTFDKALKQIEARLGNCLKEL